jgi:hypothetical protein
MELTIERRSPPISVISEAAMATSVPVPIAIPSSTCVRAGASLIPSPKLPVLFSVAPITVSPAPFRPAAARR